MKLENELGATSVVQAWARMLQTSTGAGTETSPATLSQLVEQPGNQERIFWFLAFPSAVIVLLILVAIVFWWLKKKK